MKARRTFSTHGEVLLLFVNRPSPYGAQTPTVTYDPNYERYPLLVIILSTPHVNTTSKIRIETRITPTNFAEVEPA